MVMRLKHGLAIVAEIDTSRTAMANSCFDPRADESDPDPVFDMLADPFRRRLLTAAALTAAGGALVGAGIPLPGLAASAGRATGAIHGFAGIP